MPFGRLGCCLASISEPPYLDFEIGAVIALKRASTDGTGRLDAARQSRVGQRAQDVIHRLVGHRREPGETDGRPTPTIAGDRIGHRRHPPGPGSSRYFHRWGTTAAEVVDVLDLHRHARHFEPGASSLASC